MASFQQFLSREKYKPIASSLSAQLQTPTVSQRAVSMISPGTVTPGNIQPTQVPAAVSNDRAVFSKESVQRFQNSMMTRALEVADEKQKLAAREFVNQYQETLQEYVYGKDGLATKSGKAYVNGVPDALTYIDQVLKGTLDNITDSSVKSHFLRWSEPVRNGFRSSIVSQEPAERDRWKASEVKAAARVAEKTVTASVGDITKLGEKVDGYLGYLATFAKSPEEAMLTNDAHLKKLAGAYISTVMAKKPSVSFNPTAYAFQAIDVFKSKGLSEAEASGLQETVLRHTDLSLKKEDEEYRRLALQESKDFHNLIAEWGPKIKDGHTEEFMDLIRTTHPTLVPKVRSWLRATQLKQYDPEVVKTVNADIEKYVDQPGKLWDLADKLGPQYGVIMSRVERIRASKAKTFIMRAGKLLDSLITKQTKQKFKFFNTSPLESPSFVKSRKAADMAELEDALDIAILSGTPLSEAYSKTMTKIINRITGDVYRFPKEIANMTIPKYSMLNVLKLTGEIIELQTPERVANIYKAELSSATADLKAGRISLSVYIDQLSTISLQYKYIQYLQKHNMTHEQYIKDSGAELTKSLKEVEASFNE